MAVVDTATILVDLKEQTPGQILKIEQAIKHAIGGVAGLTKDIAVMSRNSAVDVNAYEESIRKLTASKQRLTAQVAALRAEKTALNNILITVGRSLDGVHGATKRASSSAGEAMWSFNKLAAAFGLGNLGANALHKALMLIPNAVQAGIDTMDKMRLSTASIAGAMMTNDPSMKFAEGWGRANAVIMKTYEMVGRFVGSARELQILAESMTTFGFKIDLTTRKAQDQFITFANILKVITAGQNFEIQAFQELRALDQGQNFQGAMLARRLQAVGVQNVRETVQQWKEQGIFLEKVNELLGGYVQMSGEIAKNVDAQKKSTEALVKLTLASGLREVYWDISTTLQAINKEMVGDDGGPGWSKILAEHIRSSYTDIKAIYDLITQPIVLPIKFVFENFGEKGMGETINDQLNSYKGALRDIDSVINAYQSIGTFSWKIGNYARKIVRTTVPGYGRWYDTKQKLENSADIWGMNAGSEYGEEAWPAITNTGKGAKDIAAENKMLYNARKFLEKAQGELDVALNKFVDPLESSIKAAKEKIDNEFSKWFIWDDVKGKIIEESEEFTKLKKLSPKLAQGIIDVFKDLKTEAPENAIKAFNAKVLKEVEKEQEQLERIIERTQIDWKKYVGAGDSETGLGMVSVELNKDLTAIEHDFEVHALKVREFATRYGLSLLEVEELLTPLREIMASRKLGAEQKDEMRGFIDAAKDAAKALEWENKIEDLRNKANTPVEWSWNAEKVAREEALNAEEKAYNREIARLQKEYDLKKITDDMTEEQFNQLNDALYESHVKTQDKIREKTDSTMIAMSEAYAQAYGDIQGMFSTLFGDVLRGDLDSFADYVWKITDAIRDAFAEMTAKMLMNWIKTWATMQNFSSIGSSIAGMFGGGQAAEGIESILVAHGGAFPGGIRPFASGGIVNRPTLFRFASGTGLMGEAGPEGILPLARTAGGDLGVKTTGSGETRNVKVEIVNPPGQELKAKDTKVRFDAGEMVVTVWLDAFNRNAYGLRSALGA